MSITTPPDIASLSRLLTGDAPLALFENNLDPDGVARLFFEPISALQAWDAASVRSTLAEIDAASASGDWITLAADFELGYALEPRLLARLPDTGRPLLSAWRWKRCIELERSFADTLIQAGIDELRRDERVAGLTGFAGALTESAYCATVEQIRALIADGECYQVNFTFPLKARSYGAPLALYARLRQAQAVRYGAFVRHPGGVMLSRSPELFVARSGAKLTTRPMKGTAPLGHADALAGSVKDRAENLMIVDLIRNDLGRITPNGGVQVERLFEIENYATLHQMTSTITAEPVRADIGEILGALFPCGSVTGAPKIRAMELIRELEREPRGIYCGALGWIAPGGDFALNVPIRTLEIDRDRNTRLGIGSGIVADSNPRAEWSECTAKARFVTALSPEFELFETLRWEGVERHCPLLDRHLARLERSARTLGFRFQREEIVGVLTRAVSEIRDAVPRRIRLVLKANGDIGVTHAVLDPMADHPTVTIAGAILDSRDPLLAHKTTRRAMYDDTLRAATSAGHFDALFFNELGELCEGARTNVFVRLTGVLLTPPVACGLLPGVMRQVLLDEGKAVESVLRKTDLKHAEAIYVSNALRGLIEVSLAS